MIARLGGFSLDQSAGEESVFAVRDRAMADAVARLMDDDPTSRVMVWAHNGHLAEGMYGDRVTASTARQEGPTLHKPTSAAWSATDRSPRGTNGEYVAAEGEALRDARLTLSTSASRVVSREGGSDLPFFGIRPIRHLFDDAPRGVRGDSGAGGKGVLTYAFVVRAGCSICFPPCSGSSGRIDLCSSLTCGFVSEVPASATSSEGRSEILDAWTTLEAEVSAAPPQAVRVIIPAPKFLGGRERGSTVPP
ncbi:erythromycin esterase family protein [Streptomyces griseoloalbus]|uniref:erythromycin esterase family protein n=1 Tax=Streptomyces griseoloalbus TaxID=67303 RepID=UPI0033B77C7C